MASRDAILEFCADLLELDSYPDFGPMGMQVQGAEEVTKIACGVSASLALFERAAELNAQLLVVHHGLFWDNDSRRITSPTRKRDIHLRRALAALRTAATAPSSSPGGPQ